MSSWLGQKPYSLLLLSFFNIPYPIHHKPYNFSFEIYSESILTASTPTILFQPPHLSLDCCESQHPCLPVSILVYQQFILNAAARVSLLKSYITSLLCTNSKGFPFHSEVEFKVLSTVHDYVRLSIICLSTDPTICWPQPILRLFYTQLAWASLLLSTPSTSCLRAFPLPGMFFLDIHTAGSLAFFRSLHRCLSLTTVSKREVSSFPTILSFTLLLSSSSFLSLTYIFFFITWSLQEDKLLETGTLSRLLIYF